MCNLKYTIVMFMHMLLNGMLFQGYKYLYKYPNELVEKADEGQLSGFWLLCVEIISVL